MPSAWHCPGSGPGALSSWSSLTFQGKQLSLHKKAAHRPRGMWQPPYSPPSLAHRLSQFLSCPRTSLWLVEVIQKGKKNDWGQSPDRNHPHVSHFSGLLFQNVNTLAHFRTGAPAKTLKNKLHKHLWGGWTRHITATLGGAGGGEEKGRDGGLKD